MYLKHGICVNIHVSGIILSGDIETNLGPKHSFSSQGLKICQ